MTLAALLLGSAGGITWALLPPAPETKAPPAPRIEVAGQALTVGPETDPVAEALDLVRRYASQELELKLPDGSTERLRPARLGAEIDRLRLAELVKYAIDPASPMARRYQERRAEDAEARLNIPTPIRIDTARALAALLTIKEKVDRVASDAFVDLEKRELQPEQLGYNMDVYGTLAQVEAALRSGSTTAAVSVEKVQPRVLASQLGDVKFDAVLGYFETRYSRSSRYKDRTYNLRLAASKLDGTVLLPGEVFDFNKTVGPRDEANGYRVAPVIAQGELVDGIGGGTCQISGTLHGAAFFSGLGIAERTPHSRPSSYIKLGMDAAVAFPTINFRLRNPFDTPVVLHQTVQNGVVRAEVLGPKRKNTVTFFRRVDEVLPFEEVERETDKLARGKTALSQRGVPGFRTSVFRIVRSGAYAVRTKRVDHYPPTTQIVWRGTGPKKRKPGKKNNLGLEYTADEYLVMTQGPTIRAPGAEKLEPGGGTVEARTPGTTGREGWQKKAGMKVFEPDEEESDE